MRFISNRVFFLKFFIPVACSLVLSFPLQAKESFEGVWANTKAECLDKEGPNSRTLIDLQNKEKGKTVPIIDAYEHHCRIVDVKKSKKNVTLSNLCYEFWENWEKDVDSYKETVKIAVQSKSAITMDGRKYIRCKD